MKNTCLKYLITCTLFLCLVSGAFGQITTTIEQINADLGSWSGQTVTITGTWIADDNGVNLWINETVAGRQYALAWNYHVKLVDAGGFPVDPLILHRAKVEVTGLVSVIPFSAGVGGIVDLGQIHVAICTVLTPPPSTPPLDFSEMLEDVSSGDECDNCHFVLVICGADEIPRWNDGVIKYNHKKDVQNVCPDNILVLYGQGAHNTSEIPDGTTDAQGNFTSGGVFPSNRENVNKAFAYIKQKMNANNCDDPEFQFHCTSHGNGYHTQANQDSACPIAEGYAGGRIDTDNDEPAAERISEDDMRFKAQGGFDLDGDGTDDILVGTTAAGKLVAWQDLNNDGVIDPATDRYIGGDVNNDGVIDNNDNDWNGPDFNEDGDTQDKVGFDETIDLGNDQDLVDDELRDLIEDLQDDTNLQQENTRAELSQCFSGGFHHDLEEVCEETAAGAGEGEFGYGSGGNNGNCYYQKGFIEGLNNDPNDWRTAHEAGVRFVNEQERIAADANEPFNETPGYQNNEPPGAEINLGAPGCNGQLKISWFKYVDPDQTHGLLCGPAIVDIPAGIGAEAKAQLIADAINAYDQPGCQVKATVTGTQVILDDPDPSDLGFKKKYGLSITKIEDSTCQELQIYNTNGAERNPVTVSISLAGHPEGGDIQITTDRQEAYVTTSPTQTIEDIMLSLYEQLQPSKYDSASDKIMLGCMSESCYDGVCYPTGVFMSVSDPGLTMTIEQDICGVKPYPCVVYMPMDHNNDCLVNLEDFMVVADSWLNSDMDLYYQSGGTEPVIP